MDLYVFLSFLHLDSTNVCMRLWRKQKPMHLLWIVVLQPDFLKCHLKRPFPFRLCHLFRLYLNIGMPLKIEKKMRKINASFTFQLLFIQYKYYSANQPKPPQMCQSKLKYHDYVFKTFFIFRRGASVKSVCLWYHKRFIFMHSILKWDEMRMCIHAIYSRKYSTTIWCLLFMIMAFNVKNQINAGLKTLRKTTSR